MQFSDLLAALTAYFTGLTAFIQRHIWEPPQALWFLVAMYTISFITDLIIQRRDGKLTWEYATRKFIQTLTRLGGGVILLYISTNAARYAAITFFWMPQAVFALLLAGVLLVVVKNFSTLGVISNQIAAFINSKINTTAKNLEDTDNDQVAPPKDSE